MSELTVCNLCTLRHMRREAARRGVELFLTRGAGEWEGWWVARYSDQREPSARFLEFSDECCCYE